MTNSGARKAAAASSTSARLSIQDLLTNGQGVGRIDGLAAFVTGALPGELVDIVVDQRKANYATAHLTAIERASPDRVTSPCPVFPECGGCQVLHLRYGAQLEWKRRVLRDALMRIGGLETVEVDPIEPSALIDETRYRNKVSLIPRVLSGKAAVGFYAARSHTLVPIGHCPVLLPQLDQPVRAFIAFARKRPDLLADARHVIIRAGATTQTLVLCLSTRKASSALQQVERDLRHAIPNLTGLVANWDPPSENAIFGSKFATVWGSDSIRESVAGATYQFSVASFFQINTAVLERVVQHLLESLHDCKRVVDLYCGVGTFGVALGKIGIGGAGVESFRPAVDEAAANAARNAVTNVLFECATASEAVTGARGKSLFATTDAIIVDPPRKGCEPAVLEGIASSAVPKVEYLSCNPATLARDAKILAASGYRLVRVKPFDMFPHTGHIEALAEFRKDGENNVP